MGLPDIPVTVPFDVVQKDGDQKLPPGDKLAQTHRGNMGLGAEGKEAQRNLPRPKRWSE